MDFVKRVEEVWRPLMRPVPNPQSQMEACLWELLDELLADKRIRLGYPKSKMNRLQSKGDFGKIFSECRGMNRQIEIIMVTVYPSI